MKSIVKITLLLSVVCKISTAQYNPLPWSPCHIFSFSFQNVYPLYSISENGRIFLYENAQGSPSSAKFFSLSYSDNDNVTCFNCGGENQASITNLIPVDTVLIYSADYLMGSQAKKITTNNQVLENYSIGIWAYNISAIKNSFYSLQKAAYTSTVLTIRKSVNGITGYDTLGYKNILAIPRIYFVNDSTGYIAGKDTLNNNILIRSQDYGNTWSLVLNQISGIYDVKFNGSIGFAVGQNGAIYKSIDDGLTWNTIPNFTSTNFISISIGLNEIYAAGDNAGLYKSIDNGNTWTQESLSITSNISWVKVTNSGDVYFQSLKELYKKNYYASQRELNNDKYNSLIIYPNPTSNIIDIKSRENIFTNFKVYIINALGEVVLGSEKTTVDLSSISSGLYSVELKTIEGKTFRSKVVKIDK